MREEGQDSEGGRKGEGGREMAGGRLKSVQLYYNEERTVICDTMS